MLRPVAECVRWSQVRWHGLCIKPGVEENVNIDIENYPGRAEHTPELTKSRRVSKRRLLQAAAVLFSEDGLPGTNLEAVAARTGVGVSTVADQFRSNEQLYQLVVSEAGRQLAASADQVAKRMAGATPEARLQSTVDSLFKQLGEKQAWIAKLIARLLADPAGHGAGWVGLGLEKYFLLIREDIKKLLGPTAAFETVSLHALSLINQCVFYCFADARLHRIFPQFPGIMPKQPIIARHVATAALKALRNER